MGWLSVSKRDLQRIEVLTEILAGRRTTKSAAGVLGMSMRQMQRLLSRYRDGGGGALIHRSRGRPAVNRLGAGVQEYVLGLVRQNFRDFGPTLAAEALMERHGVEISRETLRKWMVGDGLWLSRKQPGICDMAAGNVFLPAFLEHFNERFAVPAQKPENLHRSLHVKASQLTDILCHREQRHFGQQLTLAYDRKQIILERSELSGEAGRSVRRDL